MRALAQQLQADFENYRKQMLRGRPRIVERATEALVEQLLPVLDTFELALGALDATPTSRSARASSSCTRSCSACSRRRGSSGSTRTGKPFDPNEHEAVLQEDGDGEPVVTDIMRTGYRLKGRVLRPAMVKVAR